MAATTHPPPAEAPPYDAERLHHLGDGGEEHDREIVLEMLMWVPWLMQEMTRAVVLRDAGRLTSCAHELQRCCWVLGAAPLAAACVDLERMGERGAFRDARALLGRAQREHKRLEQALATHLARLRSAGTRAAA